MKRLTLGLLMLTATGCGHGWLPFRNFRGALCRSEAPCLGAPPAAPKAYCDGCPTSAGYPSYNGSVIEGVEIGGGIGNYGGEVIHEGPIGSSFQGRVNPAPPSMQSIQPNINN